RERRAASRTPCPRSTRSPKLRHPHFAACGCQSRPRRRAKPALGQSPARCRSRRRSRSRLGHRTSHAQRCSGARSRRVPTTEARSSATGSECARFCGSSSAPLTPWLARPGVSSPAMPASPEFDACQIVEKLRSGPIADVFRALQQPLGRAVLIKALIPSILPSSPFAATLEREARLLAELHHPNILQIHDFVRKDERMWLVLEYVDGWTLDELIRQSKRLVPAAAAAIALELARALDHAHGKNIVHRDVQPRNVLVSRQGQVKLTGFSVAVEERLPTAPELLDGGTGFAGPAYMSPEQLLGEPPDP